MVDLRILPGELNLTIKRGDTSSWEATATQQGAPVALPTSGWSSQVRELEGQSEAPPLAVIAVDASDGATGVLRFSIAKADTIDLPEFCYWDAEHVATERTWFAGSLEIKEQVTQ